MEIETSRGLLRTAMIFGNQRIWRRAEMRLIAWVLNLTRPKKACIGASFLLVTVPPCHATYPAQSSKQPPPESPEFERPL